MIRKTITDDGVQVYWDSAKAPRSVVRKSFRAAGFDSLVPLFDPVECLKRVAHDIVEVAGLKVRGQPIEPKQLRRDVVGVTAVREIKGAKRNDYRNLFSIGCTGTNADDFEVRFFDVDPVEAPDIAKNLQATEQAAKSLWSGHKDWMPAQDITAAIRGLLFRLHGTMLKKSGGVYFLPEEHLQTFEKVVSPIEQSESDLCVTTCSFDIQANQRMFDRLLAALEAEILEQTSKMNEDIASMSDKSKKMRRNGIERRLSDICRWTEKVEYYEKLMGTTMPKLREAIDTAQYAIGVHGLVSMGANS